MSNRVCRQCGFENDSTRVFCHNCGTRLGEEAAAPAGTPPASAPQAGAPTTGKLYVPPTQPEKNVPAGKPISAPASAPVRSAAVRSSSSEKPAESKGKFGRAIFSTVVLAAILAAIIQMFRTPDGIPPRQAPNEPQATDLFQQAESFAGSPYPRALPVTTEQINNFLGVRIVSDESADQPAYRPRFSRAFVVPGNGQYQFFVEEKLYNWPIYIYLIQVPVAQGNTLVVENVGGGVGRLPVHPKLLPLVQRLVDPVQVSVLDALGTLRNFSGVSVTPQGVSLTWAGKAPGTP